MANQKIYVVFENLNPTGLSSILPTFYHETLEYVDTDANGNITSILGMGVTTDGVKFWLKGIFCKLEADNQQVAVLKATTMGLISSQKKS
jgi:hypothetical protein